MKTEMAGLYTLGGVYPEFLTGQTGGRISYDGTWTFYLYLPHMTSEEEQSIHYGDISISFAVVQDRLFILAKFGDIHLTDMPFEPALYESPQEFFNCEEGEGAGVLILGIDSYSGMLKVIRLLGLSTELSNALHRTCRELDAKHRPQNKAEYLKDLQDIYEKYPQPDDLMPLVEPGHTMVFEGKK